MPAVNIDAMAILQGIVAGVIYAAVGFLKTVSANNGQGYSYEDFDQQKFLKSVLLGAIIGAVAGWRGVSYSDAQGFLAATVGLAPIVAFVDMVVKSVYRHVNPPSSTPATSAAATPATPATPATTQTRTCTLNG